MTLQPPIALATPVSSATHDVFRAGRFEADAWARLSDDDPVPAEGGVLISAQRFLDETASGTLGGGPIGAVIEPADRVADLAPYFSRLALIAVNFPKFSDGRGFSHATLIGRHGFTGELRATGNVLIDQIDFMKRLGFTSFEVGHAVTRRYLSQGRDPAPTHYYQPAVISEPAPEGARPWLRRARERPS